MPPHPDLSLAQARNLAHYILRMGKGMPRHAQTRLPARGKLHLSRHGNTGTDGIYVLRASYRDQGHLVLPSLLGQDQVIFRPAEVPAVDAEVVQGATKANIGTSQKIRFTSQSVFLVFRNIDLTQVNKLIFKVNPNKMAGLMEVRLNSPQGPLIGSTPVVSRMNQPWYAPQAPWFQAQAFLKPTSGQHDLYLLFKSESDLVLHRPFLLDTIYFSRSAGLPTDILEEAMYWFTFKWNYLQRLGLAFFSRWEYLLPG